MKYLLIWCSLQELKSLETEKKSAKEKSGKH